MTDVTVPVDHRALVDHYLTEMGAITMAPVRTERPIRGSRLAVVGAAQDERKRARPDIIGLDLEEVARRVVDRVPAGLPLLGD